MPASPALPEGVTPGPYWVRTNTNGSHDVCGRHGKVVRSYLPQQMALADADCRRLQAGYSADEKRLRDAAPDLLEALERIATLTPRAANATTAQDLFLTVSAIAETALAKAKGDRP